MEFYGSIASVSGSITASLFTGSFKGDGGSLYNLPASGVTGLNLSQIASGNATASISSTGFTVNKSTQIQGDLSVTGSIIATNYIVSSSVTYMTTSFASGSSMFGNDNSDIHQFTGSVNIAGTLVLNGTAVGTGKLDETTFQSYTSSLSSSIGSLSSSIALTDVSQSNRITNIENTYATTGSNLFKGNQTISGSIIPSVSGSYDLGDVNHPFRHLYLSSASLYIDGTKVLGSTAQELQITTDNGQSFKILEAGSDTITLQSADGDIQLKASGGGNVLLDPTTGLIDLRGTIQVQDGNKFRSSGGTQMVFGDNVDITGSLRLTGTIQGVDLLNFSSSVSASINSLLGGNTALSSSIAIITSGLSSSIGSLSSSVAITTSGLTSTITSVSSSLTSSIGSLSSSLATTTSGLSSLIGSLSSSVATTTSGLSSSIATTTSGLSSSIVSLSSSVATTTLNTKNRVDSIETTTGSLNTFSSSINAIIKTKLDSESVISGSAQIIITGTTGYSTFSSSVSTSIGGLSSSVATTTSGLSSSIGSLSSSVATTTSGLSASISSLSSSVATTTLGTKNRVDSIETTTGSLNTFSSSINTTIKTKLDSESVISGSVQILITGTTGYSTFSSSISTSIGSLSSSVAITTSGLSSSVGSLSSSVATTTNGLSSSIGSLSSSVATTTLGTRNRVDSIEAKTSSYATTGSNTFIGNQTITGSLYISQDLIVVGSSSIQNISSSTLNIGTSIITVNTLNPSARFGGIAAIDSGSSPLISGSFLFDSIDNEWIFIHKGSGAVTSSTMITGPETYNNLGNEAHLTDNRIPKTISGFHIVDSNITDSGTLVSINSNTEITGTLKVTSTITGTLSGNASTATSSSYATTATSSSYALTATSAGSSTSSTTAATASYIAGANVSGNITGNAATATSSSYATTATSSSYANTSTSSSYATTAGSAGSATSSTTAATASYVAGANVSGNISGNAATATSSSYATTATSSSYANTSTSSSYSTTAGTANAVAWSNISSIPSGIVSSSAQTIANLPSGTVSGSAQVLNGTTIHSGSFFNGISVVSGSGQIDGTAITNKSITIAGTSTSLGGSITAATILSSTGVWSGSAQLPSGIVSSSAQTIANLPSGTVSGSSQVLNGTTIHSGSFFNGISVVSGSAQISFGGITGVPSGLVSGSAQTIANLPSGTVSGSSQISLASTTGFGSYLNQAVLTTSTPTFSTVSATTFTGALSGNASTSTSSSQLGGLTKSQLWNNSGNGHSTYTSFSGPTDFGNYFVHQDAGVTDGPAGNSYQYYVTNVGLGSDYAYSSYVMQTAVNRYGYGTTFYTWVRYRESGTWQSWNKMAAGYADTAGNITAYTINQNVGSGNSPTFAALTLTGPIYRSGAGTGYLNGNYPSNETPSSSGAIYSIGGSYVPTSTTLGNMYGVGYLNLGGGSITLPHTTGWGMYVAANGGIGVWLGSEGSPSVFKGHILPYTNNTYNLGSATYAWANLYTNDLHLNNMNKEGGNDIDKTNGNWTIQEGAENLYIINNNNGKKFKIDLTEII